MKIRVGVVLLLLVELVLFVELVPLVNIGDNRKGCAVASKVKSVFLMRSIMFVFILYF